MTEDRIFIINSPYVWNRRSGNDARAMAEEIALRYKVLYITSVEDAALSSANSSSCVSELENDGHITKVQENVWAMELPVMVLAGSGTHSEEQHIALNRNNAARYAEVIRRLMRKYDIDVGDTYLLLNNDLPLSPYLAKLLTAKLSMFYRTDMALPEWMSPQRAARLNEDTANNVDIVITNTPKLADDLRRYNSNTYNIGKGVDLVGYQIEREYPRPADIADIDTPIVGSAGTISSLYLSPDLLYRIANTLPEATVVLLGNPDPLIAGHPVHRFANVRFVSTKSPVELPAYIAAFDVCIDPSVNSHPNSLYRNAIVEYLALGKTVVCNDMEHTRPFRRYVMTAHGEDDFIDKVASALHARTPWSIRYGRARFAHTFSWPQVVERLYAVIERLNMRGEGKQPAQSKCHTERT